MATTLQQFVAETFEARRSAHAQPPEAFELVHGKRFLKINLGAAGSDGNALAQVWVKGSCLVASRGQVLLQRDADVAAAGSGFMSASAAAYPAAGAHLFLSSESCHIVLLRLGSGPNHADALVVNTATLLAVEPTVSHTVRQIQVNRPAGGIVGSATAPTINVAFLQGFGFVALLSQGPPMTVAIEPGLPPFFSDPQTTIAWSSNVVFPHLAPKPGFFDTIDRKRKGSDNKFQLNFSQTTDNARGYVILQPVEETSRNILATVRKGLVNAGSFTFKIFKCFYSNGAVM